MDADGVHAAVVRALEDVGLERKGRSRWYARSAELVWVAQLDRYMAKPWGLVLGAVVRAWSPDDEWPQYADAHLIQDYTLYGRGVPAAAALSRFDDHRSYFTMVMDHRHSLVSDHERIEAADFMARDVAALFVRVATLDALVALVRTKELGGSVDPRLARLAGDEEVRR